MMMKLKELGIGSAKRDECDLTLSKMSEVCFFFLALSTSKLDSKKKMSK